MELLWVPGEGLARNKATVSFTEGQFSKQEIAVQHFSRLKLLPVDGDLGAPWGLSEVAWRVAVAPGGSSGRQFPK